MGKRTIIVLAVNIILLINTEAALLPSVCDVSNSDCVTKTAQEFVPRFAAGIPEIGVEKCDPLFIKHVDASSPALKLILKDLTITGLKDATIKKISFDESKKSFVLKLQTTVQLECQYEMSGNLLLLQIEGKGPGHAKLRKVEIIVNIDIKEKVGKDGKIHWYFEYKNHTYTLKDKSDVQLENLFSGNELLASAAKDLVSQNGNVLILENGHNVIKAVVDGIIVRVNELLDAIPLEELRTT